MSCHVVIDARMLHGAGIGRYIRNVVPRVIASRSAWRFTLLTPRDPGVAREWAAANPRGVTLVECTSPIYSLSEQLELPRRSPGGPRLFWSPHYNIPLLQGAPLVVTVHDVAHLALSGKDAAYAGALRQAYARCMFSAVRRRARAIMFDSAFTRDEFGRLVGEPAHGECIHLGVDPVWSAPVPERSPHARPFFLFVGSIKPHKNVGGLLRAFESASSEIAHDLVIAGVAKGQRSIDDPALDLARRLAPRVHLVEEPDDETLKAYVAHATALVLPSLYEGFGLPALEAMAAGCPCIVSNAASLPEVCGDAAIYCDPMDSRDIARQIVTMAMGPSLRARLSEAGRSRAAQFDWNVTAERTAVVLERVSSEVR